MKAEKTAVMSSKNCWSFRKAKANFSQQGKAGTSPENGVKQEKWQCCFLESFYLSMDSLKFSVTFNFQLLYD